MINETSMGKDLYVKLSDETVDELLGSMQIIYRIYDKVTKIGYNYTTLRSFPKMKQY